MITVDGLEMIIWALTLLLHKWKRAEYEALGMFLNVSLQLNTFFFSFPSSSYFVALI